MAATKPSAAKTRRGKPDALGTTGELPAVKKAPKAAGLRALFQQVAEEEASLERVREIAMDAMGASSSTMVCCPDCGTEFRAKLPDVKKNLDAAIAMLEQIEGKAAAQPPASTTVVIQRPPLPS